MVDSICKVEYMAASDAAKKAMWLKRFIIELKIAPSIDDPVLLYYDSTSAIAQAKELKVQQRIKHILRRFHLVHEIMDRGDVDL